MLASESASSSESSTPCSCVCRSGSLMFVSESHETFSWLDNRIAFLRTRLTWSRLAFSTFGCTNLFLCLLCIHPSMHVLEIGTLKWCKEHIPEDGNDLTEEGQILLEDPELWLDRLTFLWECHASRKQELTTEDVTFFLHNKEVITSTFTGDWFLTEGESRDKMVLGHIQHTCEALSKLHTMTHHRCWRLIHGDLSRLTSPKWRFVCINTEKCFRTVWKELDQEFPEVFDQCVEQTIWLHCRSAVAKWRRAQEKLSLFQVSLRKCRTHPH